MKKEVLTLESTIEYLKAWRRSSSEEALTELIKGNEGLVNLIARKYIGQGLSFEELQSAGFFGLFNAINKFDLNRNINAFSTYISRSIEREIWLEIKGYKKYIQVLDFKTLEEKEKIAEKVFLSDERDIDKVINKIARKEMALVIEEALKYLDERQKNIILLRYGLEHNTKKTIDEVAEILNISRSMVVRQENKALVKMRGLRVLTKSRDLVS